MIGAENPNFMIQNAGCGAFMFKSHTSQLL
jgi:hypothetical protein